MGFGFWGLDWKAQRGFVNLDLLQAGMGELEREFYSFEEQRELMELKKKDDS